MSIDQVLKWHTGNDLWATCMVEDGIYSFEEVLLAEVQQALKKFEGVFQEPRELPPHRSYDHAISLKPRAIPVNTRPYRYSPQQNDEIERQVTGMIEIAQLFLA